MPGLTPRAWGAKPATNSRINWGHPLAGGLQAAYLFNEGGTRPVELTGIQQVKATGIQPYGPGFGVFSSLAQAWTNLNLTGNTDYTCACRVWFTAVNTTQKIVNWGSSGTTRGFAGIGIDNTGKLAIGHWSDDYTSTTTVSSGRWYTIIFDHQGTTDQIALDGLLVATDTVGGNLNVQANEIRIGNLINGAGSEPFNGYIDYIYIWNRRLPSHVWPQLTARPYELLVAPAVQRVGSLPGVIPSVTGVGRRTRKRYRPIQWWNVTAAPGGDVTVSVGSAAATCSASAPTAQVTPQPGAATATCSAFAPTAQVAPQPGRAQTTCSAFAPTAQVTPNVGSAVVTATASGPTSQVTPQPGRAQVTCSAFAPTVSTNPTVTVNVGSASVTCTASNPTVLINTIVGLAQATCSASSPTAQLAVQVVAATVACTAYDATIGGGIGYTPPFVSSAFATRTHGSRFTVRDHASDLQVEP